LAALSRIVLAALAAAPLLSPAMALGKDKRPVISIKTRLVAIEISIDPALRAYPRLYSTLAAEGKEYAAERRREAEEAWKTDRIMFRGFAWTFDRHYRLRVAAPPYVSVLVDDGRFTGGAHPNTVLSTLLWNTRTNHDADIETLFRETQKGGPTTTALARLVREAIVEEKKKRDAYVEEDPATDQWLKPIQADFSTLGAPSLAPSTVPSRASGITFHFSPYGVGPYAEGSYTAFVPLSALEPYLTDGAKRIFAGERPKSDEDE
jgi:Protein of unknown function (DUF3298)